MRVIPVPLVYRLPVAIGLALMARRWVWLLPLSMLVAMPNVWPSSFAVFAAIPRLTRKAA